MSPSFEDIALTAAPYRGKGGGCEVVYVIRRCDQGYKEELGFGAGAELRLLLFIGTLLPIETGGAVIFRSYTALDLMYDHNHILRFIF
jgi:hypothetical protein